MSVFLLFYVSFVASQVNHWPQLSFYGSSYLSTEIPHSNASSFSFEETAAETVKFCAKNLSPYVLTLSWVDSTGKEHFIHNITKDEKFAVATRATHRFSFRTAQNYVYALYTANREAYQLVVLTERTGCALFPEVNASPSFHESLGTYDSRLEYSKGMLRNIAETVGVPYEKVMFLSPHLYLSDFLSFPIVLESESGEESHERGPTVEEERPLTAVQLAHQKRVNELLEMLQSYDIEISDSNELVWTRENDADVWKLVADIYFLFGELETFLGDPFENNANLDLHRSILFYNRSAVLGNTEAYAALAFLHTSGLHTNPDFELGLDYAECAAAGGSVNANLHLGYQKSENAQCETAAEHYFSVIRSMDASDYKTVQTVRLLDETQRFTYIDDYEVWEWWKTTTEENENALMADKVALASNYYWGEAGFPADQHKAYRILLECAEVYGGSADVYNRLGIMFREGNGPQKNITRAIAYFKKAVEMGSVEAHVHIGYLLSFAHNNDESIPTRPDFPTALYHFLQAEAEENVEALYYLGAMYYGGEGVPRDRDRGMAYFQKCVLEEYVPCMKVLAEIYMEGGECEKAIGLLKRTAEVMHIEVGLELGRRSFLEANIRNSLLIFAKNAEYGYANAQSNAAWLLETYFEGTAALSGRYHLIAAEQGDDVELRVMGDKVYEKCSVRWSGGVVEYEEECMEEAVAYYENAALANNSHAVFNMAFFHEYGVGVERNRTRAKELLRLSRDIAVADEDSTGYYPPVIALCVLNVRDFYMDNRAEIAVGLSALFGMFGFAIFYMKDY